MDVMFMTHLRIITVINMKHRDTTKIDVVLVKLANQSKTADIVMMMKHLLLL